MKPASNKNRHTALLGALDTEIEVRRRDCVITVKVTKRKNGEELGPWHFNLEPAAASVTIVAVQPTTAQDRNVDAVSSAGHDLHDGHGDVSRLTQ
jgi:hypothetical protein